MTFKSDEKLYKEVADRKDEKAFRELYLRHSGPLLRFVYRFTQNLQSAEEILQDIFTQVLDHKFHLNSEANFKSWLYTVAKNKSLNHLKKEIVFSKDLEDVVGDSNLEKNLIEDETQNQFKKIETLLPQDLSEAWRLRKSGYDYQQIADQLAIPLGTVKSRFHRLVEFFKKEMLK